MDTPARDIPLHPSEETLPKVLAFPVVESLTPIHRGIHCAATEADNTPLNEVEALQVETFLTTLAEIAQAIAEREQQS